MANPVTRVLAVGGRSSPARACYPRSVAPRLMWRLTLPRGAARRGFIESRGASHIGCRDVHGVGAPEISADAAEVTWRGGGSSPSAGRRRRPHHALRGAALLPGGRASPGASLAARGVAARSAPPLEVHGNVPDETYNIPDGIRAKLGADLLLRPSHPLGILWTAIRKYFNKRHEGFQFFDRESPVVSTNDCFDQLLVPPDHPSRSPSDTYYINASTCLRTHTSAHQCHLMSRYPDVRSFLCAGDVYRRDEIDASHYPCFHQCEGVRLFDRSDTTPAQVLQDLQDTLEGLAEHLYSVAPGEDTMRWNKEYFPFTDPSLELELFYNGDWMEVLGCGVIHHDVLRNAGLDPNEVHGWAFGLGLERLAMVLFGIPDIRLFWSDDARFHEQFDEGAFERRARFQPFSKYPPVYKDISMWIPARFFDNDFCEIIRDEGGDRVEKVELIDTFVHPRSGKTSKMFRVTWRDMSRTLTNEEVNRMHEGVLRRVVAELGVEVR